MRGSQGTFLSGLLGLLLLLTVSAPGADKKQKPKPAKVELKGFKVTIEGRTVNLDGSLLNSGERTIEKLVLSFHFFDTEHKPVSTLQLEIDNEEIDPGEETEIHAAAKEPPRAVSVEITAADRGEKDLKVVNPGPYPIE